ncbi:putative G-protein coupled receptor 160 [Rhynchocyon petersi]
MIVLSSENCSSHCKAHQTAPPLSVSTLLLVIVFGKVLLNILTLGMRRKNSCQHFMEYFCISLVLTDLFLLISISVIACFRDFVLLGIRFTQYHICLFTQIISLTYGLLHYPVFLIACLDYYLKFSKTIILPAKCKKLFYFFIIILIWTSVLAYVLVSPALYKSLNAHGTSPHQCPSYVSIQSSWLSFSMVVILFTVLIASWSDVATMLRAVRITSYMNEAILYFPFSSHSLCAMKSKKILLPKFTICFLGTWLPFVLLQIIILFFKVEIPAYIEMNAPWLYFINSFLIATFYWFNCHKLNLRDITLPVDPFVNWKCCFIPLTIDNLDKREKPITIC